MVKSKKIVIDPVEQDFNSLSNYIDFYKKKLFLTSVINLLFLVNLDYSINLKIRIIRARVNLQQLICSSAIKS